jgi:hypothetical protein
MELYLIRIRKNLVVAPGGEIMQFRRVAVNTLYFFQFRFGSHTESNLLDKPIFSLTIGRNVTTQVIL